MRRTKSAFLHESFGSIEGRKRWHTSGTPASPTCPGASHAVRATTSLHVFLLAVAEQLPQVAVLQDQYPAKDLVCRLWHNVLPPVRVWSSSGRSWPGIHIGPSDNISALTDPLVSPAAPCPPPG